MDAQLITQQTLEDADIDLAGEDVEALLIYLNDLVEEQISTKITDSLSEDQVRTMLSLEESANEAKLASWMKQNVPDMDAIVQAEIDQLLSDIVEDDDAEEE